MSQKLVLAESLIWTINSGAIQVMASDLCVSQTCLFLYISQQSLLVKLNQIWHQRLHLNVLDENYLKNLWFDYRRGPFWIGLFTEHLYSKFWVGRSVRAEAKIYFSRHLSKKSFNHAGRSHESPITSRPKNKTPSKKSSQKQGQRSSKFRWWTASWGVHRGLGLPVHGFPVKMFVLVHFTAKSFGKVELLTCVCLRHLWFDLTIDVDHFETVEVSGQCQRFIFQGI